MKSTSLSLSGLFLSTRGQGKPSYQVFKVNTLNTKQLVGDGEENSIIT